MAERPRDVKAPYVIVATPGGELGQGGIDRMMNSLQDELKRQTPRRVHARFIPTRGNAHIALSPFYVMAFILRVALARLSGRADVVHINLASDGSTYRKLIISSFARILGISYVIHLHGAEYRSFWSDGDTFVNRRIRSMFEHAARVIVLGRVWQAFVETKAPAAKDRIVVIPNATRCPSMAHAGGGRDVHILFLGRIGERKGVPQLCDALARMREFPGWRATIAGDGDVAWLRKRITDAGLGGRIDAPGWQGPEDVARLLSQSDILVLPSFNENLPVSVIEGMAEGLAIVATPVGAVEDIIEDGRTGLLVKPGDVDMLQQALERLLSDAGLRRRLGEAAREMHRQRLDLPPYAQAVSETWIAASESKTRQRKTR